MFGLYIIYCNNKLAADLLNQLNCLSGHFLDLIKLSCLYQITLYHPAAAAGDDLVKAKVIGKIFSIYAAGGHELNLGIGSCKSLDGSHTAELLSGEELNNLQASLNSLCQL